MFFSVNFSNKHITLLSLKTTRGPRSARQLFGAASWARRTTPHWQGCSAPGCPHQGSAGRASWGCPSRGHSSLGCSSVGDQPLAAETSSSLLPQGSANSACQRASSAGRRFSTCARRGTAVGPRRHTPGLPERPGPVLTAPLQKGRASGRAPSCWGPPRALRTQSCSRAGARAQDWRDSGMF